MTDAEIQGCNIEHCGIDYFENGDGGKVGEGIYIGTSLDELDEDEVSDACGLDIVPICSTVHLHLSANGPTYNEQGGSTCECVFLLFALHSVVYLSTKL